MLLARKALPVHKIHYKYVHTKYTYVKHRTIVMPLMSNHYQSAMMRTNVLGDFVDKFTNDMTLLSDSSDEFRVDCKYIAYINCIIIICILVYLFIITSLDKD